MGTGCARTGRFLILDDGLEQWGAADRVEAAMAAVRMVGDRRVVGREKTFAGAVVAAVGVKEGGSVLRGGGCMR